MTCAYLIIKVNAGRKNLLAGRSSPDYPRNTSPTRPATRERRSFCYFRIIQDVLDHFNPQQIWSRCVHTFIRSQLWSGGAMRDPPFICHTQAHTHTHTQEICLFFLSKLHVRLRAELKQDANDRVLKQTRVRKRVFDVQRSVAGFLCM